MIRLACPRCNVVLQQPGLAAGTAFNCPSCGQGLQVPAASVLDQPIPVAAEEVPLPPPPALAPPTQKRGPAQPPPLPAAPARSSSRERSRRVADDDYGDDDEYEDFPSIQRRGRAVVIFPRKSPPKQRLRD